VNKRSKMELVMSLKKNM